MTTVSSYLPESALSSIPSGVGESGGLHVSPCTIGSADTSDLHADQAVPKQVQTFSPAANAIVGPTAPIVVDLRDDLTGDLTVCGPSPDQCTPIPFDQLEFVPSLGQITFRPTEKTDLTEYASGPVTVRVDYRLQGSEGAEPGSFTWTFVAKA